MNFSIKRDKPLIGIFTRPIDKGTSGSGHHLLELVRHMLRLNTDFDIRLLHYEKNDKPIYLEAPEILLPRNPLAAARVLRPYGFDLLHHSPLTIFSPLWGPGAVRTATIHSAEPNLIPRYYTPLERLHAFVVKPFYARRMDHIFTVSETSKRYFVERWGVRPERISVCYNSVGPAYRVLTGELPALRKYKIDGPYLFHVSRYSPRKNPQALLRSFAEVSSRRGQEGLRLVIAGSGWSNPEVLSFLRSAGLEERVVFTGFTPEEEIVELFNGARAFVFPSRAEGFGMPNVEAMACGCPVVTTRAFAIPEIVGDAALVADDPDDYRDIAEKAAAVMENPCLRESLVRKGLAWVKRYSWETSARTVLETYGRLLA